MQRQTSLWMGTLSIAAIGFLASLIGNYGAAFLLGRGLIFADSFIVALVMGTAFWLRNRHLLERTLQHAALQHEIRNLLVPLAFAEDEGQRQRIIKRITESLDRHAPAKHAGLQAWRSLLKHERVL